MTTKLEKPLKREITINEQAYVITITPEGLKLTVKGHRKGQELLWKDLVGPDAAVEAAPDASPGNTQ
jgi:hypothetical protein